MAPKKSDISTTDFFVPHISRVRANAGQLVGLHVRQKIGVAKAKAGRGRGRVVLFVHGGNVPVAPAFDLGYKDYSWMAFLAREGFKVYGVDLSGYGASPRPMMDDPTNVSAECQHLLIPGQLRAPCPPNYPFQSHTIHSDWAEIDSVVEHLCRVNRVSRISLIGWSAGGARVGGYAAFHPEKVDRVVLFAPGAPDAELERVPERPGPGAPTKLQSREELEKGRWDPSIGRPGQVAPGVRNVIWRQIMQWDPIGASWGPPGGVMRSPNRTRSGWNPAIAGKIKAPVLLVIGELDNPAGRARTYDYLTTRQKAYVQVAGASHFMNWEKQRRVLHRASLDWLAEGRVNNARNGRFRVDWNGTYTAMDAKSA